MLFALSGMAYSAPLPEPEQSGVYFDVGQPSLSIEQSQTIETNYNLNCHEAVISLYQFRPEEFYSFIKIKYVDKFNPKPIPGIAKLYQPPLHISYILV